MRTRDQLTEIVNSCACAVDPKARVAVRLDGSRLYIQIEAESECAVTGKLMRWAGRKWPLSAHMTETEVVCTVFKAWQGWVDHELREKFYYKHVQVFDPHRAIQALLSLDGMRDVRDSAVMHKESVA